MKESEYKLMTETKPDKPSLMRSSPSFTTTGMMTGIMPEKAKLEHASVNVVLTFQKAPTIDNVAKVVESLFYYHRLSTVPQGEEGSKKWRFESVGEIDPKRMVREIQIKCNSKEEWAEIVQQQTRISLRRDDLPWWEFVILKNKGKEDSLLIFRFDHCIGDGLAFAKVFTKMIRHMDGSEVERIIPKKMVDQKTKVKWGKMILGFPKALFEVATSPHGKADDPTCFSKNITGPEVFDTRRRKLVLFDQVPLHFIKDIKNAAGISLNDVLLTTWSRAVHEYCSIQECPVLKEKGEKLLYRTLMPLGFPNKSEDPVLALRNTWVSVSLKLPVGMSDIMKMSKEVNKITTDLKSSPLALLQLGMQNKILRYLPLDLSRNLVFDIHSKRSTTISNVPGPEEQIMVAEEPVKSIMFFTNHLHPVLSFSTYNGYLNSNLAIDDNAIKDVHLLPKCFMKSLILFAKELDVEIPESVQKAAQ